MRIENNNNAAQVIVIEMIFKKKKSFVLGNRLPNTLYLDDGIFEPVLNGKLFFFHILRIT